MSETITAAIGWSSNPHALTAGQEAAAQAAAHLPGQGQRLAILLGSSWFDQSQLLQGVRATLGDIPVIGESTAGEIVPQGLLSHSCVVMLLASTAPAWSIGIGEAVDRAPREAGQQAAYGAMREFRGSPRTGFLLFGDGLVTSYTDVVRGIQEVLGTSFLVVGGMAGDDLRFAQTYQYCNDRVVSRTVVGALIGGPCRIGVGIEHGFAPISKPRHITAAHGNVLVELDHRPAASVYEEYFGPEQVSRLRGHGMMRERIAYPLGIQCEAPDQWLLRGVMSFQDGGSLVCNGEILEGSWLQLMIGSRQMAIEAAQRAAQQAIQSINHLSDVLVLDCIARRILLGPAQSSVEIAAIRQVVGPSVPLAGPSWDPPMPFKKSPPSARRSERPSLSRAVTRMASRRHSRSPPCMGRPRCKRAPSWSSPWAHKC